MKMAKLNGRVALLTGAGAGIAKATAKAFVREGAKVALLEINRDAGLAAEQEIRAQGGEAIFIETDVTKEEDMRRAVDLTVSTFGGLNILFNCAGGSLQEDVPVHEMSVDIWHRTMALNLLHPFLSCRFGIPHLMAARQGSIINVASHLGLMGTEKPAYAASKGGIMSFTKTLAAQYVSYGIRANAIAAGQVRTERAIKRWENAEWMLAKQLTPAARERQAKQDLYPFSVGEPQDIAEIAVFLASDDSRMLTGTTLAADGGRSSYLKIYAPADDEGA
jgi:NAD(P)-dependent dehydrogenase (short-subunit alcohol dehydrogenase family)